MRDAPGEPAHRPDHELAAAAAGGDRACWAALVDRHVAAVWAKVSGHGLDERAAAEVCEVIWLRLAQQLPVFDRPAKEARDVRAWLLGAAELEADRATRFARARQASG